MPINNPSTHDAIALQIRPIMQTKIETEWLPKRLYQIYAQHLAIGKQYLTNCLHSNQAVKERQVRQITKALETQLLHECEAYEVILLESEIPEYQAWSTTFCHRMRSALRESLWQKPPFETDLKLTHLLMIGVEIDHLIHDVTTTPSNITNTHVLKTMVDDFWTDMVTVFRRG